MKTSKTTSKPKSHHNPGKSQHTVIWGKEVESDDYIIVPRSFLLLSKYDDELAKSLQPRHMLLILAIAARKYQKKPTRAYWEELAKDLGANANTVRKWAYQLEQLGLLRIQRHKGPAREPHDRPGTRNERNTFDISPFVRRVQDVYAVRKDERARRKRTKGGDP